MISSSGQSSLFAMVSTCCVSTGNFAEQECFDVCYSICLRFSGSFLEILQVPRWLGGVSPRSINSSLLNMSSLRIPCGITQGLPTALSVNFRWLLLSVSSVRKESYNLVSLQGVFKVQHRLPSLSCYVLRVVVSSTSVCAVHFCRNRSIGPRIRLLRVSWSLFFPGEFLSTAS